LLEQLDEALLEQQQAAYVVPGAAEEIVDPRKRKKAAEVRPTQCFQSLQLN
jgi:hypothetical protein